MAFLGGWEAGLPAVPELSDVHWSSSDSADEAMPFSAPLLFEDEFLPGAATPTPLLGDSLGSSSSGEDDEGGLCGLFDGLSDSMRDPFLPATLLSASPTKAPASQRCAPKKKREGRASPAKGVNKRTSSTGMRKRQKRSHPARSPRQQKAEGRARDGRAGKEEPAAVATTCHAPMPPPRPQESSPPASPPAPAPSAHPPAQAAPVVIRGPNSRTNQFLKSLTAEERRLLEAEGVTVPHQGPLPKERERELKRLRRKIKNKLSAQDSRRRRKEYLTTLEERNQRLEDEVAQLKSENNTLSNQVRRICNALRPSRIRSNLQGATAGANGPSAAHTGRACVMMMAFLMLASPSGISSKSEDGTTAAGLPVDLLSGVEPILESPSKGLGQVDLSAFTSQQTRSFAAVLAQLGLANEADLEGDVEAFLVKVSGDREEQPPRASAPLAELVPNEMLPGEQGFRSPHCAPVASPNRLKRKAEELLA